jgi:hypothetical protein
VVSLDVGHLERTAGLVSAGLGGTGATVFAAPGEATSIQRLPSP